MRHRFSGFPSKNGAKNGIITLIYLQEGLVGSKMGEKDKG